MGLGPSRTACLVPAVNCRQHGSCWGAGGNHGVTLLDHSRVQHMFMLSSMLLHTHLSPKGTQTCTHSQSHNHSSHTLTPTQSHSFTLHSHAVTLTYSRTHTYTHIHALSVAHLQVTQLHAHTHTHSQTQAAIHRLTVTPSHAHTCSHMHTQSYTHAHSHTHSYFHMQSCTSRHNPTHMHGHAAVTHAAYSPSSRSSRGGGKHSVMDTGPTPAPSPSPQPKLSMADCTEHHIPRQGADVAGTAGGRGGSGYKSRIKCQRPRAAHSSKGLIIPELRAQPKSLFTGRICNQGARSCRGSELHQASL